MCLYVQNQYVQKEKHCAYCWQCAEEIGVLPLRIYRVSIKYLRAHSCLLNLAPQGCNFLLGMEGTGLIHGLGKYCCAPTPQCIPGSPDNLSDSLLKHCNIKIRMSWQEYLHRIIP